MKKYIASLLSGLVVCSALAVTERTANNGNLVMQDIPVIPQQLITDLNRYQNVRSAPFHDFTLDGKSIYISTRFGDVAQLHKVDIPGGSRQQLTFFKEPIGSVTRRPDGEMMAFTMDAGGNEYAQVFLLDPKTGESKMLSDGESRNGAIVWSHKGGKLAFQSTRRNGASNDVWIMDSTHPESAKMVVESPDGSWWGPAGWSHDDKKLLIQQYVSASDSRIYLLDLATGSKQLLQGGKAKPSVNSSMGFALQDNGYFFASNQGSEFNRLAFHAFDGSQPKFITKDIPWNVSGFDLSDDGKRGAFIVNADGIDQLYLMDMADFSYKKVKSIPVGLIGGMAFSPDGQQLALTLNTAQTPSDTFLLDLGSKSKEYGKLVRWTHSEVGGLNTENFSLPELVRFESFDKRQIPSFVYKPQHTNKGPHPVIISIHGGPESQFRPAFRSTYQLWMDTLNAAVIAPNVRGSSGYGKEYINLDNGTKREDSVKDIGALLDWIKTQPDLDENRVAVIGGSYGGYMVLASAAHYSDRLKGAIDIVGISNFVTFLENTKSYRRDLRRVEYGDERDPVMKKHLEAISPNNHVDKINLPMFVVQGENDPRVPVSEAEQIVEALRANGKPVWYMNALNEGHGYRKKENRDIYQQAVVLFLQQHL